MTEEDLMSVQINRALRPRSLVGTSIPGLLSNLQNEWDELMLETFALKSQLDSTRQELAQALYQHDASCRVIARLMRERDEARAMLAAAASSSQVAAAAAASASSGSTTADGQRPMEVSEVTGSEQTATGSFSAVIVDALNKKCGELSGARKGRAKALEAAGLVLSKDKLVSWSMQKTFTSHKSDKGAIHCCATYSTSSSSSKSDILITGGADNCVCLTDAVSGAVMSKLAGHSKKVNSVALRHLGSTGDDDTTGLVVFTASADKTVKV
jgi:pre-mRNA-processing factor 19